MGVLEGAGAPRDEAVAADEDATLGAREVHVEDGGRAHVAHLPHALLQPLPHGLVAGAVVVVGLVVVGLVLVHDGLLGADELAELVSDVSEDELGGAGVGLDGQEVPFGQPQVPVGLLGIEIGVLK